MRNLIFQPYFLILIISMTACKKADNYKTISCDCEKILNNHFVSNSNCTRFGENYFDYAERQSKDYAHSGTYCTALTKNSPYGMAYVINHVKPHEHFHITVWRNSINREGSLLASADNIDKFYLVQKNINGIKENDWEQLSIDLIVPSTVREENITIFVMNTRNVKTVYFDDLSIGYLGVYPKQQIEESYFIDNRDGQRYKLVKIGSDWWMAENLKFKTEENSFVYNNVDSNVNILGRLYTWDAAYKAVPDGWTLPTDDDWKKLEKYLGMPDSTLNKYGNRGTDITIELREFGSSGFNAKFAGVGSDSLVPVFYDLNRSTCFWTATEIDSQHAWCREISQWTDIGRFKDGKAMKFSVRCIKKKNRYG